MLELELAFCPPTLGGSVSPPLPCMRSWLWSVRSPHAGRAGSQREWHCVSYPHALSPLTHNLPKPLPACRSSVAALQPHTRPGPLPVTRPGLPPRVSGGQRLWAPPSTGHYSLSSTKFWNVRAGRPWEFSQPGPLVHRQETSPHGLRSLPGRAVPWADTGQQLGAPAAHGAPSSSHLRQSETGPRTSFGTEPLPHFTKGQLRS